MQQFNRKYPSGAEKTRKKSESIKVDEKCKGLLDRFVVVASGTGEPTEECAGSSTQVANSSYVCLLQLCPTEMTYWVKNYVIILTGAAHWMTY